MAAASIRLNGTDITLRQLQYLSAVAREKNLSAAARRCHVSQPALAEQIEKLESRLGKLIVRGRRTTSLTPLGAQIVEKSTLVLAAVDDIERLARYPESLRIGMIETVAPYLMPQLLAARPERIIPVQAQTKSLLEDLDHGRLDAAVLADGTVPEGMFSVEVGTDELHLAVHVTDPNFAKLRKGSAVSLTDVSDYEMLLLADGHCLRGQVVDVCRTAKTSLGFLEAATIELLVEMVAKDLGVTLVPSIALSNISRHTGVKLLRLTEAPARRLVLTTTQPPSEKIANIADSLKKILG
jgi:LysR family hydrogen peroxide-inducible transcriptional activator